MRDTSEIHDEKHVSQIRPRAHPSAPASRARDTFPRRYSYVSGEVTVQARTWNLKSGISEFGILAPSKFHDVEIPRFQQKSWNREFEAHTRNFGIWNPSSLLLANSKFPDSQFQFRPPAFFCKLEIPRFPIPIPAPSAPCKLEIPRFQIPIPAPSAPCKLSLSGYLCKFPNS